LKTLSNPTSFEGTCHASRFAQKSRPEGENRVRLSKANTIAHKGEAPARLLTALVFVLAFAFQSFVAQTHIHIPGAPNGLVSALTGVSGISHQAPDQAPQDDAKCPICQVATAMGAAVKPVAILFALPSFITTAPVHDLTLPARAHPAHAWTSRGPPAH
jgi:hypothetical protein